MLNVATNKFGTFCALPDYIMLNNWKDSQHITDDYSCYLYSCHNILVLSLHLNDTFGNRWIGRGGPIAWIPRSPDPTLFHFWGYMKTLVYQTTVDTQQDSTPVVTWLSYSPLDQRFAGSKPAGVDGLFQSVKIQSMTSFGRDVKPWVPCRRFTKNLKPKLEPLNKICRTFHAHCRKRR